MSEHTTVEKRVWVPDWETGQAKLVPVTDLDPNDVRYDNPSEVLLNMKDYLVKEVAYNGRDLKNAMRKIRELQEKQANEAVLLHTVMVQLGEMR